MLRVLSAIPILLLAVSALAQSSTGDQERGATGWSGTPGSGTTQANDATKAPGNGTTGQKVEVHDDAQIPYQPEMASGIDLKGLPKRFAPSNTPE